jgi:hypothetical protein
MLGLSFLVGVLSESQVYSITRMACYPPAEREKDGTARTFGPPCTSVVYIPNELAIKVGEII